MKDFESRIGNGGNKFDNIDLLREVVPNVVDGDLIPLLDRSLSLLSEYSLPLTISTIGKLLGDLDLKVKEHSLVTLLGKTRGFPDGVVLKHGYINLKRGGSPRVTLNALQTGATVVFFDSREKVQISGEWPGRQPPNLATYVESVRRLGPEHPLALCYNPPLVESTLDLGTVLKEIKQVKNNYLREFLLQKTQNNLAAIPVWPISKPKFISVTSDAFRDIISGENLSSLPIFLDSLLYYPFIPRGVQIEGQSGVRFPFPPIMSIWSYLYVYFDIDGQYTGEPGSVRDILEWAIEYLGVEHPYAKILQEGSQTEDILVDDKALSCDTKEGRNILNNVGLEDLRTLAEELRGQDQLGSVSVQKFSSIPLVVQSALLKIIRIHQESQNSPFVEEFVDFRTFLKYVNKCIEILEKNPKGSLLGILIQMENQELQSRNTRKK